MSQALNKPINLEVSPDFNWGIELDEFRMSLQTQILLWVYDQEKTCLYSCPRKPTEFL